LQLNFATAKELAKTFAHGLPSASLLSNSFVAKNTSYSRIYAEFKNILDSIAPICPYSLSTRKISVDTNFFKGTCKNKKMANETIILSFFKEKIRGLTSKNMEIIFTDGSVSENFTGSAFVHLNSNSIKSFYTDSPRKSH